MQKTKKSPVVWLTCLEASKPNVNLGKNVRIYHPNAHSNYTSNDGADDHFICPDCGKKWWVEYD